MQMRKKKLLFTILCIFLCLSVQKKIVAEENVYYWAISKNLETLYLSPIELNDTNLYVDFGSFDADKNTTWIMPWSKYIEVDGVNYRTTNTVKNVIIKEGMKPKSITRWFWEFENLQSADLTNLDTSDLMYMQETFAGCKNITNINVSNFNTKNVVLYAACFYNLESIETLDLSSFEIREDADMIDTSGSFISELPSLKTLKLPKVINEDFSSPGFLKWIDTSGNIIDIITSADANKTLMSVNAYNLVVNNVLVHEDNCDDILKDGKVCYNPTTKTLTLDNATLNKYYHEPYNDKYALIYTEDSLNIVLKGNNILAMSKINAGEDDWVCGILFPMMISDDYEIEISGDNLMISGGGDDMTRGIMAYDGDCLITNKANISIDIEGKYARGIYSLSNFNNKNSLNVNVSGEKTWGIYLDNKEFNNEGYVSLLADEGAFCAKKVVDQHLLKGSTSKTDDISTYSEIIFIDDYDNEYWNEYVVGDARTKSLVMCGKEFNPVYSWTNDYSKCKAEINCENCGYKESEVVDSVYTKISDATIYSNEKGKFTATFTNPLFEEQVINVEIEKTKPSYVIPKTSVK